MKVLVFGSTDWSNYSEVIRQFTLVLEDMKHNEDNELTVVHSGSRGAENMTTEYLGKIEKFMRQKGFSVREKVFSKYTNKAINSYDMIVEGGDLALVFSTDNDKRISYCLKVLKELNVPTKVIND
jgi:hypothetical protein